MGKQPEDSGSQFIAGINVTPFVGVMLCLLIAFMQITPFTDDATSILLPRTRNPVRDARISEESSIVLSIPDDNDFYLGRDKVPMDDVTKKVSALLKERAIPDRIVYIKCGKSVKYGTMVSMFDAIREAGCDRIGLVSQKVEQKRACRPGVS